MPLIARDISGLVHPDTDNPYEATLFENETGLRAAIYNSLKPTPPAATDPDFAAQLYTYMYKEGRQPSPFEPNHEVHWTRPKPLTAFCTLQPSPEQMKLLDFSSNGTWIKMEPQSTGPMGHFEALPIENTTASYHCPGILFTHLAATATASEAWLLYKGDLRCTFDVVKPVVESVRSYPGLLAHMREYFTGRWTNSKPVIRARLAFTDRTGNTLDSSSIRVKACGDDDKSILPNGLERRGDATLSLDRICELQGEFTESSTRAYDSTKAGIRLLGHAGRTLRSEMYAFTGPDAIGGIGPLRLSEGTLLTVGDESAGVDEEPTEFTRSRGRGGSQTLAVQLVAVTPSWLLDEKR